MMQSTPDPRGMRLLLARHGATAWNDEGRYQGRTDLPLSERGISQATQLGEWLNNERIDIIVHSGSQRTTTTLDYALPDCAAITTVDRDWRELDHGDWEGLTYRDLLANAPDQARAHWADPWHVPAPNGETLAQVAARVNKATTHLINQAAGKTVLLIAHATPLQLLIGHILGTPPTQHWGWKLDLGSLSCLELYATGPIVNWLNRGYTVPPAC